MKKVFFLQVFIAALLINSVATAQVNRVFIKRLYKGYLSFNLGYGQTDDTALANGATTSLKTTYDKNVSLMGEAGFNLGQFGFIDNVKIGVELGYAESDVDAHTVFSSTIPALANGVKVPSSAGSLNFKSALLNMYHEFNTGTRIIPYYGFGLGIATLELDNFGTTLGGGTFINQASTGFLYQGTLGVNYIVSQNVDVGIRARYQATHGIEFKTNGANDQEFDYQNLNLTANLTYNF